MAGDSWEKLLNLVKLLHYPFDLGLVVWDYNKWLEIIYVDEGRKMTITIFKQNNDDYDLIGARDFKPTLYKTVAAAYYELPSISSGTFNEFF